jgi:hypothetical protein
MSDGKATKTAKTYQAHDIPQVYLKNFVMILARFGN